MIDYNIKTDFSSVLKQFETMGKDTGRMKKAITRKVLNEVRKEARRNIRKTLKRKTGRTASKMEVYAFKDGSGKLKIGTFYGRILEGGYNISPKNQKFLMFKVGKKWIKTSKTIHVAPRDLVKSVWKRGTTPERINKIANEILEKEFRKWKGK